MVSVNIHHAKTHLSKLIDQAANGEAFIIAKAGKPLVKVVPLNTPEHSQQKRLGALESQFNIPHDIDTAFQQELESMFEGNA